MFVSLKASRRQADYAQGETRRSTAEAVHAAREAEQYRQAIMAGAIIGAPADPEAFA